MEEVCGRTVSWSLSGTGAKLFGGRWNNKGNPVVYAASSRSLAILELLVHIKSERPLAHYSLIPLTFDSRHLLKLDDKKLPKGWDNEPANSASKILGDAWLKSCNSLALEVPSVVVPEERNYLINPVHPDFHSLNIGKITPYTFDSRLA